MLSIANDDFFDLFQRARIHQNSSRIDWVQSPHAIFRELDALAVFEQQNLFGYRSQLMGQRRMPEQMPVFSVYRNKILRLYQAQDQALFLLAGVPGYVNCSGGIVVIHQSPPPEHMIQHAEDGLLITRNNSG